jgi:hypothetical protein
VLLELTSSLAGLANDEHDTTEAAAHIDQLI